jgi:uncharacterized protein (TIGR02265 family)
MTVAVVNAYGRLASVPRIDTSAGVPLTEDFDSNAVIRAIPDDYVRRGILFQRLTNALSAELASLALEAPPGPAGYAPLENYPTRDYFRIFDVVAARAHPGEPRAQQWRLAARRELDALIATSMGRVELSTFNHPGEALLRYQQISPFVTSKPRSSVSELPGQGIRIEYIDPVISIAYGVGVFEGVVMKFKMHPRISVDTAGDLTTFDVRWGL